MTKNILIDGCIDEEKHNRATYEIYCIVHEQYKLGNIALSRINRIFGNMIAASPKSWRVIGITEKALELYRIEKFLSRVKGVQRAHLTNRIDTMKELIECEQPLSKTQLFENWTQNDKTVLGLNSENQNIANISFIPFENPNGFYFTNAYIGFRFNRKHEGNFLKNLWEENHQ